MFPATLARESALGAAEFNIIPGRQGQVGYRSTTLNIMNHEMKVKHTGRAKSACSASFLVCLLQERSGVRGVAYARDKT
eukprot:3019758-Amphidinium_carterae.1